MELLLMLMFITQVMLLLRSREHAMNVKKASNTLFWIILPLFVTFVQSLLDCFFFIFADDKILLVQCAAYISVYLIRVRRSIHV